MEVVENTTDDALRGFIHEVYALDLKQLSESRKELLDELEQYPHWARAKGRLNVVETQIKRLQTLPNKQSLKNEMLKYYCLCDKHKLGILSECSANQFRKKYPFLGHSYTIQDLSQEVMHDMMNVSHETAQKICEPYVTKDKRSREQAKFDFNHITCNNCGTLNDRNNSMCTTCKYWFF